MSLNHCVKSVHIRSFFCSEFSCIRTEYGDLPRKYSVNIASNTPAGNFMFNVNNRNIKTSCEICSKLTLKIQERRHWRRSGIFIVNFEQISHLALVLLLLTLSR